MSLKTWIFVRDPSEVYLCVSDEGVALWREVGARQFHLHRKHFITVTPEVIKLKHYKQNL